MFKPTQSSTKCLCSPTCTCPLHHHKPMPLRKEVKILEHFASQRVGEESRESFFDLLEDELKKTDDIGSVQHIKYKHDFLNRFDPLKRKINLSDKKNVDQRFIRYLLSDASPKNIQNFLFPEARGWVVSSKEVKEKEAVKPKQKAAVKKKATVKKAAVKKKAPAKKAKAAVPKKKTVRAAPKKKAAARKTKTAVKSKKAAKSK